MRNNNNKISNECYNALVHDYALVDSALDKCSLETPFYSETLAFTTSFAGCFAHKNGFDLDAFFKDVTDCRATRGANSYSCKADVQSTDGDSLQPILTELIRAFKNRTPGLGERFERVVEQNERVACAAVAYLVTEYLYLDRSASYHERERRNEAFRLAMFEAHAEPLYIAAFNTIRSYAASMARAVLAADVKAAIGGGDNAN